MRHTRRPFMPRSTNTLRAPCPSRRRGIYRSSVLRVGCVVYYAMTSWGERWEQVADGVHVSEDMAVAFLAYLLATYDPVPSPLKLVSGVPDAAREALAGHLPDVPHRRPVRFARLSLHR